MRYLALPLILMLVACKTDIDQTDPAKIHAQAATISKGWIAAQVITLAAMPNIPTGPRQQIAGAEANGTSAVLQCIELAKHGLPGCATVAGLASVTILAQVGAYALSRGATMQPAPTPLLDAERPTDPTLDGFAVAIEANHRTIQIAAGLGALQ